MLSGAGGDNDDDDDDDDDVDADDNADFSATRHPRRLLQSLCTYMRGRLEGSAQWRRRTALAGSHG